MSIKLRALLSALIVAVSIPVISSSAEAATAGGFAYNVSDNGNSAFIVGCDTSCPNPFVIPSQINGLPVTKILNQAFRNDKLTKVSLPSSLETIESGAFQGNKLSSIKIPASVWQIGNYAFDSNKLKSITFLGDLPSDLGLNVFTLNSIKSVIVSSNAVGFSSTFAGANVTATGPVISRFYYESETGDSWIITGCFPCNSNLVIPAAINGGPVTSIGESAFTGRQLASVSIPDSVTTIANYAFENNQIKTLALGNSVTTIGYYAFSTNQIKTLAIPSSVTEIGFGAFRQNKLTAVAIASANTNISSRAFSGNKLVYLSIGDSLLFGDETKPWYPSCALTFCK